MVANPSHVMKATTVVGRGETPMMQDPLAICLVLNTYGGEINGKE